MRNVIVVLAAALVLGGCDPSTTTAQVPASAASGSIPQWSGKTVGASLTGYNHTDQYISAFYVDGEWGGNIFPGTGGGKFVCCAELPDPWQPGLKVKISWDDHEGKTHSRDVEVPQYDPKTLSAFNVHFLRSGDIKVFANRLSLWHADYPLKGQDAELKPGVPIKTLPRE